MPPAAFEDLDINAALLSLPSCARCRSRRVKCDSQLPMCANCARSGHECTYRDHTLGRVVSRPHLAALVARIGELRALKEAQGANTGQTETGAESRETANACIPVYSTTASRTDERPDDGALEGSMSFWGPSSFYAQLAKTLVVASEQPLQLPLSLRRGSILDDIPRLAPCYSISSLLPTADVCLRLVRVYHESVETFYPVFGWDALDRLVHDIYREHHAHRTSPASARSARRSYGQSSSSDGRGPAASASAESLMLLCIVLAATFRLLSSTDQRLGEHAKAHYACFQDLQNRHLGSMLHSTRQPANSQVFQVQMAAVQCIYLLLGPPAGTAWQFVGYARTLYDELPPAARTANRMLYRTLLCLDVQTAHAFGRAIVFADTADGDGALAQPPAVLADLVYGMARIWSVLHTATDGVWLARVHADLQGWVCEWNNAISAQLATLTAEQAEHLRTCGSLLHSQCLLALLGQAAQIEDLVEPLTTKPERQLVAARLINDTHRLYYAARSTPPNVSNSSMPQAVFPLFWTHVHSLASACLFLLNERNESRTEPSSQPAGHLSDRDRTLHRGLMLLLALDPSQTLFQALSDLHNRPLALTHGS